MNQESKDLIAAIPALISTSIFVNAIVRNINSGENTVAYHKTPYKSAGIEILGITLFSGDIRYNGYDNAAASQIQ